MQDSILSDVVPDGYRLGKLCVLGHEWKDTKQTLRKGYRCLECHRLEQARWREANPEKHLKAVKNWQQNNTASVYTYTANWYKSKNGKAYQKTKDARRRSQKSEQSFTVTQLQERFAEYGNRCVYCKDANNLTADHLMPLILGGSNDISNIVPACLSCNSSKSGNHPLTWYTRQVFATYRGYEFICTSLRSS